MGTNPGTTPTGVSAAGGEARAHASRVASIFAARSPDNFTCAASSSNSACSQMATSRVSERNASCSATIFDGAPVSDRQTGFLARAHKELPPQGDQDLSPAQKAGGSRICERHLESILDLDTTTKNDRARGAARPVEQGRLFAAPAPEHIQ